MHSDYISYLRALLHIKLAFNSWVGRPVHVGNGEYNTLQVIFLNDRDELIFDCGNGVNLKLNEFTDYNGLQSTVDSIFGTK